MVKTVEVKVTDPKLLEEVDALKEKVRTAETIWNDLEIQNTTLRKQLVSAQQQVQVYEDALWMFMSDPICSQMYLRKVLLACHCATKLIHSSYPRLSLPQSLQKELEDRTSIQHLTADAAEVESSPPKVASSAVGPAVDAVVIEPVAAPPAAVGVTQAPADAPLPPLERIDSSNSIEVRCWLFADRFVKFVQ